MIVDYQGRVPRYVIDDDKLIHQWTGCYVILHERSDRYLRKAMKRLKQTMYDRGYSAGEILCSTLAGSYSIK